MKDNAAAIWSAITASFAALSSILIMLIQRRNLLESVRPEIVLTGWTRRVQGQGDTAHEVISFQTIRNVGRGAAFHMHMSASQEIDNCPTAVLSTTRLPILATNEENEIKGEILVWWKNVKPDDSGAKCLLISIVIYCWDSRGMRHETQYNLFTVELLQNTGVAYEIAPGVMLANRITVVRSAWLLKTQNKLRHVRVRLTRILMLNRLFRKSK